MLLRDLFVRSRERREAYRCEGLIERFGAGAALPDVLMALASLGPSGAHRWRSIRTTSEGNSVQPPESYPSRFVKSAGSRHTVSEATEN